MNDTTTNEQLSALMDGELPRDELRFLLCRLDNDESLAPRWSRYHVISAVLRQQVGAVAPRGEFVAGVMARLDSPAAAVPQTLGGRLLRWAGGGAIAASVAIVALLATRPGVDNTSKAGAENVVAAVAPAAPAAPLVGELRQPLPPPQLLPAGYAEYAQPAAFESIVPNYAPRYSTNGTAGNGSEGFVPYVLIVGARQQPLEPQPAKADASAAH